ncbi:hypothetical protein Pmani_020406 [Petrolisthes manimaculis]|uniref:Uncharacterized protein n=1 Tax=Petrolisthes manimaculis TaxID=1843537 RepID=A0AAE1U6L1_9EUCA|nr:hypothetical protein Pmani_020406 [Petrolisthes manimaculis]
MEGTGKDGVGTDAGRALGGVETMGRGGCGVDCGRGPGVNGILWETLRLPRLASLWHYTLHSTIMFLVLWVPRLNS